MTYRRGIDRASRGDRTRGPVVGALQPADILQLSVDLRADRAAGYRAAACAPALSLAADDKAF
jgi:hypothetical protein